MISFASSVVAIVAHHLPTHDGAQGAEHCFNTISTKAAIMRPVKTIATLASLVVLAGSILAASWVGLALLGF